MQAFLDNLKDHPDLRNILILALNLVVVLLVVWILLRVTRNIFARIQHKKSNLNTQITEKLVRFLIIFVALMWLVMSNDITKSFGQTLFQSTTIIAAVAAFAAQSVLSDVICGIMISTTKPFEIGDRIELENGTAGVVKEITLRHVVLQGMDTQRYVVPNSRLNAQTLRNMSFHTKIRSVEFRFPVAYPTDTEFAAQVIRQAIIDSPYSVPGRIYPPEKEPDYGKVYFLAFRDSSLEMGTTAYYEPSTPTEVFKDDINTRVKKALEANNIEIPYNYLNVVMNEA